MAESKKDISDLIKLKYDLDIALENNDIENAHRIFEQFKKVYETVTGRSFVEESFIQDAIKAKNTKLFTDNGNIDLEIEMEI